MKIELLRDLEAYHAWAMRKVFGLCRTVGREGLNVKLPLGFGSIVATLQHMAAAERLWLDRWRENSSLSMPDILEELEAEFCSLATERSSWIEREPSMLANDVAYYDIKGNAPHQILGDMVIHVLNHAVHHLHRSQVLNMLRSSGKTPDALDYIVWLRQK